MDSTVFIQKYMKRIGLNIELLPNIETLRYIHRQHLLNIPFENLDIMNNKSIEFDNDKLSSKILDQNRGGICYELNGLLYELLSCIGFDAKLIAAKVLEDGNEFDHVLMVVNIASDKWLVDVGFGDNFFEPLRLEENVLQKDLKGDYKIVKLENDKYELQKWVNESDYSVEYTFSLQEKKLQDFRERCFYFETSLNSMFTRNRMCSLEKENGRMSLKDDKLIITKDGKRIELEVKNETEFSAYLKELFGI